MENNKRKSQSDVMLEVPLKYYTISTQMRCALCSTEISSFIAAAQKEIDVDYFKRLTINEIMNER